MKVSTLTVADAMTTAPHAIAPEESLAAARMRLNKLQVRHLPVRTGGRVVGIISERDLDLLATLADIDFSATLIGSVMTEDPYKVLPHTRLAEVAAEMATRRIGSALIVDESEHLLGIFTYTDSLTLLSQLLESTP